MEMLLQLWRPESELDGINSAVGRYHYLLIGMHHLLGEGDCTAVLRSSMLYMEV